MGNQISLAMRNRGIFCIDAEDKLIWKGFGGRLTVYVKHIYLQLHLVEPDQLINIFPSSLWKTSCSLRIIIFVSLVFHNKNLTWDNLQKRNWSGLAICPLCRSNIESNLHIFLLCPQSQMIWQNLDAHFGFSRTLSPPLRKLLNGGAI